MAGGIYIRGNLHGSPALNCLLIAIGAVLASFMGTTGASMLMIRPLIRANDNREHTAHVVIFFIFIVSNIGGSLTPLGDPPLFLGFLKGVTFFWTMSLFPETLFCTVVLLAIFFALDSWIYRREGVQPTRSDARTTRRSASTARPTSCCCSRSWAWCCSAGPGTRASRWTSSGTDVDVAADGPRRRAGRNHGRCRF